MAKDHKPKWIKLFPWILIILGTIGLIAAFVLTLEKIELLKNPGYIPSCNINPLLSCSSIMKTSQAALLGFPNPIIGVMAFPFVITSGVVLLAGAKLKKWYWQLFNLGPLVGVLFVHWLFYESVYNIGALCPYCMVVWAATIPLFLYTTLWNIDQKNVPTPKSLRGIVGFATKNHASVLLVWYLVIFSAIIIQFWDRF